MKINLMIAILIGIAVAKRGTKIHISMRVADKMMDGAIIYDSSFPIFYETQGSLRIHKLQTPGTMYSLDFCCVKSMHLWNTIKLATFCLKPMTRNKMHEIN